MPDQHSNIEAELILRAGGKEDVPLTGVSPAMIQQIFYELAGKTDEIVKTWDVRFVAAYEDLEHLNNLVVQQINTHLHIGPTVTVEVEYTDNQTHRYASWEKFGVLDKTRSDTVSEVNISYEFLCKLPELEKPQRYKISIILESFVAPKDSDSSFFRIFFDKTITLKIEYIDYSVARGFVSVIEEWIKSLEALPDRKIYKKIHNHGYLVHIIPKTLSLFAGGGLSYGFLNVFNIKNDPTLYLVASWGITAVVTLAVLYFLTDALSYQFMSSILRISPISIIKLTRGDERNLEKIRESNKKSRLKAIGALLGWAIELIASFVASYFLTT